MAAADGLAGPPDEYRDYDIPPPPRVLAARRDRPAASSSFEERSESRFSPAGPFA
jgi:hypothetical protein